MLELDAITARNGSFELTANWSIKAGQSVAIIGPSGGGKSTLLDVIAGFITPISGRITIAGQDVTDHAPGARPLSILFQDNNLFPHLSIAQNVGLGISGVLRHTAKNRGAIDIALGEVGLEDLADRSPSELSGGQRQRAALARTLLRNRPVLALDEPFAALGPALRSEMLALVKSLCARHETTLLMITHNPDEAEALGGDTIFVEEGHAHAPVETQALFAAPPKGLADYLGQT